MINWILQKNLTKPEVLLRIKSALNGKDEIFEEVEVIPFSSNIPTLKNKNCHNIIYGSTTFMLNAYNSEELNKAVFIDPSKFQMKNYVNHWKENVLNHSGTLLKFGDLDKLQSEQNKRWFIRPNNDAKEFADKVETYREILDWSIKVCQLNIPELNKETDIWISEPQLISKEWRLFIVDDQIISTSRYMNKGKLEESETDIPDKMIEFAKRRISEYKIDDVYVMDVTECADNYKVIECNCFNGTGFYKHNIEEIISSVNRLIKKKE